MYVALLEDLDIEATKRAVMLRDTPNRMKWQQICQMKSKVSESEGTNAAEDQRNPQYFTTRIGKDPNSNLELLSKLRVSLLTEPVYWVSGFCDRQGINALAAEAQNIQKME